jgi:cyanophycinase
MCETMMIESKGGESHRIGDLRMAPGLGLIQDAVIDQPFAERGRMGRLLGAVAQNPRVLVLVLMRILPL